MLSVLSALLHWLPDQLVPIHRLSDASLLLDWLTSPVSSSAQTQYRLLVYYFVSTDILASLLVCSVSLIRLASLQRPPVAFNLFVKASCHFSSSFGTLDRPYRLTGPFSSGPAGLIVRPHRQSGSLSFWIDFIATQIAYTVSLVRQLECRDILTPWDRLQSPFSLFS